MNPFKKLRRLLSHNRNDDFLTMLYSQTCKPLLIHPQIGKSLIDSYLVSAKFADFNADMGNNTSSVFVTKHNGVAVIDITGTLTDREIFVPCGVSPVSYEAIRYEMEALFDDDEIHTIVGRFDTPGGVASQNMDLSDYIYSKRGKKKMIAVVDDMAYSAGFGIASAFDEIWITRTGGVGSVGVVSYHEDHSERLKRSGISVEYIYAGDKKIFGNPTEPLSEEARDDFRYEVKRLYELFVNTVARNLNMSVDDVIATQAGTYHGNDAIDIGFAHKLGTFDDLMNMLFSGKMPMDDDKDDEELTDTADVAMSSTDTADVVMSSTDTADVDVDDNAVYETTVKALCSVAGVSDEIAEKYIESNASIEEIRDNLLSITDNSSVEIITASKINEVTDEQLKIQEDWEKAFKLK